MSAKNKKRIIVMMNPNAGLLNPLRDIEDVLPTLKSAFPGAEFVETQSEAHAARILKHAAAASAPARIVIAGGDGTFHHAAQLLAGSGAELALIPLGSANNIASSLGIPEGPPDAVALAVGGVSKPIDIGKCGRDIFIEAAGIGFHATAMGRYGMKQKKSLVRAAYSLVKTMSELQPFQVLINADGRKFKRRIYQLTANNLPMYGTNFKLAPAALPDDGFLDVTLIPMIEPAFILPLVAAARAGLVNNIPRVETFRCRSLSITAEKPIPVHLDAQVREIQNIKIHVLNSSLNIVRP